MSKRNWMIGLVALASCSPHIPITYSVNTPSQATTCNSGYVLIGNTCVESGVLDSTFNSTGFVVTADIIGAAARMRPPVFDSAGRILTTASTGDNGSENMTVRRFSTNGTTDTDFGTAGVISYDSGVGDSRDWSEALGIDTSGRLLIAGMTRSIVGNYALSLFRIFTTGTFDTNFNTTGMVLNNDYAGAAEDHGMALTTDSSGNIVVAGFGSAASGQDILVWRYLPTGVLDTTFNTTGSKSFAEMAGAAPGATAHDAARSILIDSSGRILVTGTSTNASGNTDLVVLRLLNNGDLDTDFNGTGFVVHANAAGSASSSEAINGMALDSQGRILVVGSSHNGTNIDLTVWRFTAAGILDTTFNSTGYVVKNGILGGNGTDVGTDIKVDSAGRIVVSGYGANTSANLDALILRLNSDGTDDTTFATNGVFSHGDAAGTVNQNDYATGLAVDSNGRYVITGVSKHSGTGKFYATIWRVNP